MATRNDSSMSANNDCFTCTNQLTKKQKSSVICIGCQKPFCKEHHQEHRKLIENDFNGLIEQHNTLRQNLYSENNDSDSRMSKLLKMIDNWEKEAIANIKTTAATNKTRLTLLINEEKDQLKNKFKVMADELKTNQSSSDYVESDIHEWQKQISDCKQKLEQLQTSNNDFINMDIKLIDWSNIINIYKRKDVIIKTNIVTPTRLVASQKERPINCSHCDKSFYESNGYSNKFCSQDCETNYDVHNPDDSSSDGGDGHNPDYSSSDNGGDGCFHGNCVVSLANGSTKLVKDIRKGDVLKTPHGLKATVNYIVKILRKNKTVSMISFDDGLVITPWHPVRINGKWTFPYDIGNELVIECEEVYNFALDVGHIVIINGIECVTLGHNFKGDVIEHSYYGTNQVLEDLRAMDVFNNGFIELFSPSTVRNKETGLVSGIRRCAAKTNPAQLSNLNIVLYNEHV